MLSKMATKNNSSPTEKSHHTFIGDSPGPNGKYDSLSLNQNHHHMYDCSKSFAADNKNHSNNGQREKNDGDSCISNMKHDPRDIKYPLFLNQSEYGHSNKYEKEKYNSSTNSCTLFLHIAAFENTGEGATKSYDENESFEKKEKKCGLFKNSENQKHIFSTSSSFLNPFEIPRQQENEHVTPEVAQFKASQILLNSNEAFSSKNSYSNDKMFTLVFNGVGKTGLNVLSLPEVITVPRTAGKHLMIYSTTENVNIKSFRKDDLTPWKGNPQLKNYFASNNSDSVKAVLSTFVNGETQAQCYSAIHFDYLKQGNKITKKVFSATTPSSQTPLRNTFIVIFYDIEKDVIPFDFVSPQNVSLSASKRTTSESKNDKSDGPAFKKPFKEDQSTPKRLPDKKSLIGFSNVNEFLDHTASPGPSTSPSVVAIVESNNKLFDMAIKLKNVEKELLETKEKAKKTEQQLKEIQGKMDILTKQLDKRIKSGTKKENKLEHENAKLKEELDQSNLDYTIELEKLKDQIKADSENIKFLEDEISALKKSIEEKSKVVELKQKGKYTPEVQLAMAELQTLGIRDHAVGPAMKVICNMLGLSPNAVPSARTVAFNSFFAKAMNLRQLREIIEYAASTKIPSTLCTDESIRNDEILHNYIIQVVESDQTRDYVLGTVKGLDKSTSTIMELMEKLVKKLDSDETCKHWELFMMNLGNLMTDQASTNTKLAKELPKLKELIAANDENWDQLTLEQRQNLIKVRSFYCQLHVLQNMTPVVIKSLLDHEKLYRGDENIKQPLIFVLLQELSRFLGARAASKYDVAKKWKAFCDEYKIKYGNVPDFKGHRFNIFFAIGAAVFYLLDDIIKFYETFKTQMHDSKINIGDALKDPLVLSHLHLLAAVNAYITGPMTRLTENSPTINSLTEHAKSLIQFLERVNGEPLEMLYGFAPFEDFEEAEEVTARSKDHLEHLDLVSPAYPEIISDAIEYVSEDLLEYSNKKFAPFLEGGEHYLSTADLRSVPRSNRRCESIFGLLGSDYSVAPKKRIARRDIKVQSKFNKNFDWFKAKPQEERERIVKESMAEAHILEKDAAEDEKAYGIALWKNLVKKKEKDDRAAAIKSRKAQEAFNKVQQNGGIWRDVDQMNITLNGMNATKKKKAIEDQIRCHKLYLQTIAETNSPLFKFSSKKVAKDVTTLIRNLTTLMTIAQAREEDMDNSDDDED